MNKIKASFFVLALAMLCVSPGCGILGLYKTKVVGVYDTQDNAQSSAAGHVAVYSLDDDGAQTPLSGELGTSKTNKQGYFAI